MSAQSTTPPPKKSFRTRVGTVMRRSSTSWSMPGLPHRQSSTPPPDESASIPGSPPPKIERMGSNASLRQLDTTPPLPSTQLATDTIPESPAREAAALAGETTPQGPSLLGGRVITAEPASEPSLQAPEERRKTDDEAKPGPASVTPSAVVNSPEPSKATLAPVFTAEPEEISPDPAKNPARTQEIPPNSTKAPLTVPTPPPATVVTSAPASTPQAPAAASAQAPTKTPPPTNAPPIAPRMSTATSARAPTETSAPSRASSSAPPAHPAEISRAPSSAPPTPPAETEAARPLSVGYFDMVPRTTSPLDVNPAEDGSNVWADHSSPSVQPSSTQVPVQAPTPSDPLTGRPAASKTAKATTRPRGSSIASSQVIVQQPSRKPSSIFQPREREIVGTTYTWSNPSSTSLILPSEDPFADPRQSTPGYQLYASQQPTELTSPIVADVFDPRSPRDETMIAPAEPVTVPLPAMHEVMLTNSVRHVSSSTYSSEGENMGYFGKKDEQETNERHPLIPRHNRPSTPPIMTSFPEVSPAPHNYNHNVSQPTPQRPQPIRLNGNGSAHSYSYGSVSRPYRSRGWLEYALPHGTKYFVNPSIHATTDLDLRNFSKLETITSVVDTAGSAPEGCDMWVREGPTPKKGWRRQKKAGAPVISWVDHRIRRISSEIPSFDGIISSGEDDRLDDEYRYWSFVESHPAHITLPQSARQEAIDVLHWSFTDPLLAHPQPIPPPFNQDECHNLLRHLNDPNLMSNTTHTRMIARILLRVAHWRQTHFRPNKPLPYDVSVMQRPKRHVPIGRMFVDIIIGILCLGIPFFFVDRSTYAGHLDLENGMLSNPGGSMFLVGACACLVAAVILSASVTLMTLPGLHGIARIAGLVAIMCSVLSMITSFITIIRYKAELAHGTPSSGSEGFVLLSRRSVLLSLPLVFLAYSVAGFITGVVIYSFQGSMLSATAGGIPVMSQFDDWSRFFVIGVLGGIAGVLFASAVIHQR